jgi:hypothetical protein
MAALPLGERNGIKDSFFTPCIFIASQLSGKLAVMRGCDAYQYSHARSCDSNCAESTGLEA